QVANSGLGWRLHQLSGPARLRALTALTLLLPGTPMLFQGQEWASGRPFTYFADHHPELAKLVNKGRHRFMAQFPSVATPAMQARLPNPADPATFDRCKLDWSERDRHAHWVALHRDLLRLRRDDARLREQRPLGLDGAVLSDEAFVLRYFDPAGDDDR